MIADYQFGKGKAVKIVIHMIAVSAFALSRPITSLTTLALI